MWASFSAHGAQAGHKSPCTASGPSSAPHSGQRRGQAMVQNVRQNLRYSCLRYLLAQAAGKPL